MMLATQKAQRRTEQRDRHRYHRRNHKKAVR